MTVDGPGASASNGGRPVVPAGASTPLLQQPPATIWATTPMAPAERAQKVSEVARHSLLRQGASGPEVVELRRLLKAHGFDSKEPKADLFGPDTERAVCAFQLSLNRTPSNAGKPFLVDGIVGDETWGALQGLTGVNKLPPGTVHVGRNSDRWQPPSRGERPGNEQIHQNVLVSLASMSGTDRLTPEQARQVSADLQAGRVPSVPVDALADLGVRALEAMKGPPRADFLYSGANVSDPEFDALMFNILGSALVATREAHPVLRNKIDDTTQRQILEQALGK